MKSANWKNINIGKRYWQTIYILFACSALSSYVYSAVIYTSIPLSLTGKSGAVKPNILLFIDNSGSMIDALPNGEAKATVAKSVAKEVLTRHRDLRWGLASFGSSRPSENYDPVFAGSKIQAPVQSIDEQHDTEYRNLVAAIDGLQFNTATPSTSAYYELTRYFRGMNSAYPFANGLTSSQNYQSPIEYRCQKNFVIFISDGTSNTTSWYNGIFDQSTFPEDKIYRRTWRKAYTTNWEFAMNGSSGGPNMSIRSVAPDNSPTANNIITINDGGYEPLGIAKLENGQGGKGVFGLDRSGQPFIDSSSALVSDVRSRDERYACSQNDTCAMYTELGMSSFTKLAHSSDLITSDMNLGYGLGIDKEGKSFDDPDFLKQTIETYTIGFDSNVPMMEYAAEKGGGAYYTTSSRLGLDNALSNIMNGITLATASFSAIKPNAVSDSDGQIVSVQGVSLNTKNWSSQIRFYDVINQNRSSTGYVPNYSPATSVAVISTDQGAQLLNTSNTKLQNKIFSIQSDNADQWKKLAQWLTRREADATTGYRVREPDDNRYLGDVLGSSLVGMGLTARPGYAYGNSAEEFLAIGSNDGMVHLYRRNSAAVNGYTDVFQYIPGLAKNSDGLTINSRLETTALDPYGATNAAKHQNLVNGPISWLETYSDNKDSQVYLTGTLGQGGRAAYALNVAGSRKNTPIGLDSSSNGWVNNVPLWDTSSTTIGDASAGIDGIIGHTFGEPVNGRVALVGSLAAVATNYQSDIRYATILGSGFDAPVQSNGSYPAPSVFVLDSLGLNAGADAKGKFLNEVVQSAKGKLLKQISVAGLADNIDVSTSKGMTSPVGLDLDGDGLIDVAYAGDQNGNVYRFDFRSDQSQWNAEIIFKGNNHQPITAAPNVYRNPVTGRVTVLFGTGSELYAGDLADKSVQRFYGIQDPLTDDPAKGGEITPVTPNDASLLNQTYTQEGTREGARRTLRSGINFNQSVNKGWYIELTNNGVDEGERVVTQPSVGGSKRRGGSVVFTTRIFNQQQSTVAESCTADVSETTSGFMMIVNAETGGRGLGLRYYQDNPDFIGMGYAGELSASKIIDNNQYSQNLFGATQSGKAVKLNRTGATEIQPSCNKQAVDILVGSSVSGGIMQSVYCPENPEVKRISWREIF